MKPHKFRVDLNGVDEVISLVTKYLNDKKIVFLDGDLGAGKTTLVKKICQRLGSEDQISSPTFSIINEYECRDELIYHMDLYRLNTVEELMDIGAIEYFDSGNICFVEWPELASNIIEADMVISISKVENQRIYEVIIR